MPTPLEDLAYLKEQSGKYDDFRDFATENEVWKRVEQRLQPLVSLAQRDEFIELCNPLVKWLNDNFHPHVHIVITPTSAELSSGETAYTTEAFLLD